MSGLNIKLSREAAEEIVSKAPPVDSSLFLALSPGQQELLAALKQALRNQ